MFLAQNKGVQIYFSELTKKKAFDWIKAKAELMFRHSLPFLVFGIGKGKLISKALYGLLNSSKKRTKLTILSFFFTQDSEFRLFFWKN